jgi:hypothetical protein
VIGIGIQKKWYYRVGRSVAGTHQKKGEMCDAGRMKPNEETK